MPIYFSGFITALLSVSGGVDNHNLPQSGRLLYCVKIRTRVQNTLQAMALNHALRRGRGLDCNWAEGTASLVSGRLHQSKAGRTAALIRAIAAADPGVGRASRKTSPATAPGAALVDASRCGTRDSIGDGGVPGRPEPLRPGQERSQLHRNHPMRTHQR